MCNRPKKPQRKPKPRASLVSGENSKLGSLIESLRERIAKLFEVFAVGRIQPAINHALRRAITGKGGRGVVAGHGDRIADVNIFQFFDVADQIADFAGDKLLDRFAFGNELAEFQHFDKWRRL